MDRPDPERPRAPGSAPLLRPAVPPRAADAPARRSEMERSLGPFAARRATPSPPAEPARRPATPEGSGIEELPWAALDAPLWDEPAVESAAATAEAAEESAPAPRARDYETEDLALGDEAEWLEYEAGAEAPMAEDALEPLAEAAEPGQEPLVGEELLAPPDWEYGFAHSSDAEPAEGAYEPSETESWAEEARGTTGEETPPADAAPPRPLPAPSPSAALEDVATRLESIARSLRGRSPTELLSGAHDPLQVLIAGYALGLEAARAAQERPPEDG